MSVTFSLSDDVFRSLVAVDGDARVERIKTFASCFGQDVQVLDAALKDEMARRAAQAAAQARMDRINSKMLRVQAFDEELSGFTLSDSIVKLLDRAAEMEKSLADADGKLTVMLRFENIDGKWRIRAVGKALDAVTTAQPGATVQDGRGTKYDYFDGGKKVHGNLKPHILGNYAMSEAAKLLKDFDAGIKKGAISAFDAAMKDPVLKLTITRQVRA
jgi:hypothetical protein